VIPERIIFVSRGITVLVSYTVRKKLTNTTIFISDPKSCSVQLSRGKFRVIKLS